MRGPERLPSCKTLAGSSLHKTCLSRPPVSAYHACLGLDRPLASDMHARKCPLASGLGHLRTCMPFSGRPRPRQA
eukprot:366227-Chlamydomonas_euryale.AAC.1